MSVLPNSYRRPVSLRPSNLGKTHTTPTPPITQSIEIVLNQDEVSSRTKMVVDFEFEDTTTEGTCPDSRKKSKSKSHKVHPVSLDESSRRRVSLNIVKIQ